MCIKEFDAEKIFFDKMTMFWTKTFSEDCFLYSATQKVAEYYVIPSELWVSVRPSVRQRFVSVL